jgi:hypothetical protein
MVYCIRYTQYTVYYSRLKSAISLAATQSGEERGLYLVI